MSEDVIVEGVTFTPSKLAAASSGYTQDYVGQLCRGGHINAQRIGGLWFVSMDSLLSYKAKAEEFKPQPPVHKQANEPDSLITFDGKDYISAARTAEITGYHQDYVGQLARTGTIMARQVGNRWYVDREKILAHKAEKDALLAAVQSESVGLASTKLISKPIVSSVVTPDIGDAYFKYSDENADLVPVLKSTEDIAVGENHITEKIEEPSSTVIPIRRVAPIKAYPYEKQVNGQRKVPVTTRPYGLIATAAFTIVIVLVMGFSIVTEKKSSYARAGGISAYTASVAAAFNKAGGILENVIVPELIYRKGN